MTNFPGGKRAKLQHRIVAALIRFLALDANVVDGCIRTIHHPIKEVTCSCLQQATMQIADCMASYH